MLSIKKKVILPIIAAFAVLFAVLAITAMPSGTQKVSAAFDNAGYALEDNGIKRQGSPTWEDTASGLSVSLGTSDRFEIKLGDQTANFTTGKYLRFYMDTTLSSIYLGGCNYTGGRNTAISIDLSTSNTTSQYSVLCLLGNKKLIQVSMSELCSEAYKAQFAVRFYSPNAASTFVISEMSVGSAVDNAGYALTANEYKRQGSPTTSDTLNGLSVALAAKGNRYEIQLGDQSDNYDNGKILQFYITTTLTSITLGGCNYSGGRNTNISVDLSSTNTTANYSVVCLSGNTKKVKVPMTAICSEAYKSEFAVRFYDTNDAGTYVLSRMKIVDPTEDFAAYENGVSRQGSPSWADSANGLSVTLETSDRFEIKLGDQASHFAAGYNVQFIMDTTLTSIYLGGCNYSGGRNTAIQIDLSETNSTADYSVICLSGNKKVVRVAMTSICSDTYKSEFAIRFYSPNTSSTFVLSEMTVKKPAKTVTVENGEISQTADIGDSVTVKANAPAANKYFAGWSDGSEIVSANSNYTFTVSGDVTLTATYGNVYTVTVVGGTIGGETSASVQDNETATVLKGDTPDGKYFIGWSDGSSIVSEEDEYEFTPTGNVTMTATYGDLYTVSVTNGTIGGEESAEVAEGGSATVVANEPASGYYFLNWTDGASNVLSTSASYTFTVSDDIALTANYRAYDGTAYTHGNNDNTHVAPTQKAYEEVVFDYKISSTANGDYIDFCLYEGATFYGYFQLAENGMRSAYDGIATEVQSDGYIRVTMTTADITVVKNATIDPSTNPAPETIKRIMIRNTSGADGYIKNVHFNNYYDITVTNGTGGGTDILEGTSVTVTANSAPTGKVFSCWKDGSGNVMSTNSSYTFTATADISLTAFYGDLYTVSVANGTIGGETSAEVIEGTSATVVANAAASGYYFLNWTNDSDDSVVSTSASYTFTVSDDIALTANYRAYDGTAYTHGIADNTHVAPLQMNYEQVIFDYKISSTANGDYIDFCLYEGGTFYGYFQLAENGMRYDYDGITTEVMPDGYIRVTMTTAALTIVKNAAVDPSTNPAPETIKRIMIRSASGADGYIKNVHFNNYADVTVTNGTGGGDDLVIGSLVTVVANAPESGYYFACWKDDEDNIVSDDVEYTFTLIEDVSLTAVYGEHVSVTTVNGKIGGETSATVINNSRITLVANAAADGYYFVNWTDSGSNVVSVEKICTIVACGEETYTANFRAYDGTLYEDGVNGSVYAASAGAFSRVSFEYKVTSDSADAQVAVCLLLEDSGSDYYGYFYFNDYGAKASYAGVTVTRLDDGYYRVAIDPSSVAVTKGTVDPRTSAIERIFIRDSYTDTDVYIRNATFTSRTNVFEMYEGASVRLNGQYGIRFRALISYDKYDADANYGMMILPYDYLTKNGIDMSGDIKAQLDAKSVKYRLFSCTPIQLPSTDYYIQGSLTNILESNLSRSFIGIAFYEKSGTYYYAALNGEDGYSANKRTIKQVAERAITKNYQGFAGYSSEKQDYLIGIVDSDETAGAAFTVNAFDSLYNFKKDDSVSESATLSLSAAKGESEFGQIVLTATSTVADKPYVIMAGDLTHSDGSTILSSSNFDLYNAWYTNADDIWICMDSTDPHYESGYSYATALSTGYYPNALVPFYAASANAESVFDRTNGDNQTIFIRFNIPLGQKAGTYTGTFRIYVIGVGYKDVSVSFKVNDFVLPEESNYKSKYGVDFAMLGDMFGVAANRSTEEYKELYNFMKEYGINTGYVPSGAGYTGASDLANYIAVLEEYYNDPKVTAIQILTPKQSAYYEYKKTSSSAKKTYEISIVDEFDSEYDGKPVYGMRNILKSIAEYCVTNDINLFEKLYFRLNDEPSDPEAAISSILSYNAVKNSIAYALSEVDFSGHTDIQASLTNIPILITISPSQTIKDDYGSTVTAFDSGNKFVDSVYSKTAYYTDENGDNINDIEINNTYLKGFVPIYAFVIGTDTDPKVTTLLADSDPTTHVWWYSMVQTPNPYPNFATNADHVITRSRTWAQYYYGVEGELYHCVNYWADCTYTIEGGKEKQIKVPHTEAEIWSDGTSYHGAIEDGLFVYPNVTRYDGDFKYCATYKLVAVKEGIDDYNYICYAQSLIDNIADADTKSEKQALLDGYVAAMVNTSAPRAVVNSSKSNLQTQRGRIAKLIEDILAL
ncbi:MAG: InlB B-repeat-containing protein [Clostridia bacterium]|nr:InlB B-repeat-containing protein [Clostridia bacterium]